MRDCGNVSTFWEELAEQAVGVLIGAALPGRMRIGEVERDVVDSGRNLLV